MNNEQSSIFQEYSQIQEKNQWMAIFQVHWSTSNVTNFTSFRLDFRLHRKNLFLFISLFLERERCKRSWGEKMQLHDQWVEKDTQQGF